MITRKKVAAKKKADTSQPTLAWSNARIAAFIEGKVCPTNRLIFDVDEFPSCCAFDICHNFSSLQFERMTTLEFALHKALFIKKIRSETQAPFVIVTLSEEQTTIAKMVSDIGFKAVHTVLNPNTENKVTVWIAKVDD